MRKKLGGRVAWKRPEAEWATHGQDESWRKSRGGPNPSAVQNCGMTCG